MKILCLNITGLHLGFLGCHGNEWVATPHLDRLAAEGVVFDSHIADTPGGPPGAWTGRHRFPPGRDPEPALLPDLLQALDVPAAFVGPQPATADATALEATLDAVVTTLDQLEGRHRWLLWADLPPLLPPWQTPADFQNRYLQPAAPADDEEAADDEEEEAGPETDDEPLLPLPDPPVGPVDVDDFVLVERIRCSYAAEVTYLDAGLGLLLEELRQRRLLDQLLLVVGGARGLALGEHGIVGDWRPWLHDEFVHVPLLLRLPAAAEAGRRVAALTQPVDLLPTLLRALGAEVPPESHGHDLLPLARGEAETIRPYACSGWALAGAEEWALRTPEWVLLLPVQSVPGDAPRGRQLYIKPEDRWEVNDVAQHHLELTDHLEETLRAFVDAAQQPGPLRVPVLRDAEELLREIPD